MGKEALSLGPALLLPHHSASAPLCPCKGDLANENLDPIIKYYFKTNDKHHLFLKWSCLKYFPFILSK